MLVSFFHAESQWHSSNAAKGANHRPCYSIFLSLSLSCHPQGTMNNKQPFFTDNRETENNKQCCISEGCPLASPLQGVCGLGRGRGAYLCRMEILLKYFSDFTEKQAAQYKSLEELYKDWNTKINVISRKDIDSLYEKHILHSLSIAAVFDFPAGIEIIDIGTGGGFPGVPLSIFLPEVRFHLVDSIGKKLKIIEAIKEAIDLPNITTQHSRAEEIKGRKFDFAVSRAVAPLKELWRWSTPLLKNGIYKMGADETAMQVRSGLVCLKGGDLKQEIAESGLRPKMTAISHLFDEEFFKEKYILYTPLSVKK
jgi:16S rRNA (guanine527-N7)-methyltransferase